MPHRSPARPSNNSVKQTSDSFDATESKRQSEWESSATSVSRSETDVRTVVTPLEDPLNQGWGEDSNLSTSERETQSGELESVLNSMTERPAQSSQKQIERFQEVDALLEKIHSGEEENESGCGGNLVKFIIFIWIFGIFSDLCN